jgi:ribonuclease HI
MNVQDTTKPWLALFTDGGCVDRNPSDVAITWAWRLVVDGQPKAERSGFIRATELPEGRGTNNQAEFYAVLDGFRHLEDTAIVYVFLDSEITLKRWAQGAAHRGIPSAWYRAMGAELARHGGSFWHLMSGHPTRASLAQAEKNADGKDDNGRTVSVHNVRVDLLCRMAGALAGLVLFDERTSEDEAQAIIAKHERTNQE